MLRFGEEARATASRLRVAAPIYRLAGVAQLAGAAGLIAGLRFNWRGVTAAACLVALMVGALTSHIRAGDPARDWLPAIVAISLAIATAILQA